MKKTRSLFKKLFAALMSLVLTFGTSIVPVMALEDVTSNDTIKTVSDVITAYNNFKTEKNKITDKINELQNSGDVGSAKQEAITEATEVLDEINNTFNNDTLNLEIDGASVLVDFKDDTSLGVNDDIKSQVINESLNTIETYNSLVIITLEYLNQSEEYTQAINLAGQKLDISNNYVQALEKINVTFDSDLFETYSQELVILMASESNEENLNNLGTLSNNIDNYNEYLKNALKNSLVSKYDDLSNTVNNSKVPGLDSIKSSIESNKNLLASDGDLVTITTSYLKDLSDYKKAVDDYAVTTPTEEYVDNNISSINENLNKIYGINLSTEKIDLILSMLSDKTILDNTFTLKNLSGALNQTELADKISNGELNNDILKSFVDLYNNQLEIVKTYNDIKTVIDNSSIGTKDELKTYLNESAYNIVNDSMGYELGNVYNATGTDEERLQILNKIGIIGQVANYLEGKLNINIDEITFRVESLSEYYSKSCNNKISSLIVNDIELDINELNHKIYVGNDVTSLKILVEKLGQDSIVEILNADNLKVGSNEVIILIKAPNGDIRQYTLEVIRAEKEATLVAPVVKKTNSNTTATVTTLGVKTNDDVSLDEDIEDKKDISNTSDSDKKYNEKVKEEDGLSFWVVFIIVILIAIIGYIIYKLFGEKEDVKIEKAFSNQSINKSRPVNKNTTNKNRPKNKKRK